MGNIQPVVVSHQQPARPFAVHNKRASCVTNNLLLPTKAGNNHSKNKSPLQQLILLQDWQRVLVRAKLYPAELRVYTKFQFHGGVVSVLPLHLVCALDPPVAVVQLLLEHYVDAAALPIRPVKQKKGTSSRRWKSQIQRRYTEWRRTRSGAFPEGDYQDAAQQSLLDEETVYITAVNDPNMTNANDNDGDSSSSISSRDYSTTTTEKNVILQLSPSGGLHPMPLDSDKTDETSISTVFRVHWDLEPLSQHVVEHGTLLALHIACFYSASASVLQVIANAYPAAALCDVLGMLPIHWVAAGWTLPPLLPPPTPFRLDNNAKPAGPLQALQVLKKAVPDSVRVQSGNHGMTSEDYINECMEESEYKDACIRCLHQEPDALDDASLSSDDSVIFSSDASSVDGPSVQTDSVSCIGALATDRDWEAMLAAVEDEPAVASKWIYGMDEDDTETSSATKPVVWKRLPIHLACAYGAPIGLVKILLQSYPSGASAADPRDGSTPLHMACHANASLAVIRLLVSRCPEATQIADSNGWLPLHAAVLSKAPHGVIEALVEHDPATVCATDKDGKTPIELSANVHGETSLIYELLSMIDHYQSQPWE